jgi:prepilin-type N-terminal cleavage/methylation domain-containing protein
MSRKAGFTMIELMVAVIILTVGLVLILQSLSSGMRAQTRAQSRYLAASIAAEKLEELEEQELIEEGLDEQFISEEKVTKQNRDFSVKIEIVPQPLDLAQFPQDFLPGEEPIEFPKIEDRLQKVSVSVSWQETATPQELILSTYLNAKQEE